MIKQSTAWKKIGIPSPTKELASYMDRVLGNGIEVDPPKNNLLFTDAVTSIVLHREGQFQVEMIVARPNTEIPEHTHDDVESFEVGFSGDLEFFVKGIQTNFFRSAAPNGTSRDLGRFMPVPQGMIHGGRSGPNGAVFLSVQRWREGLVPTHVGINWTGPTVGKEHHGLVRQ